jgi:hypothetical protein
MLKRKGFSKIVLTVIAVFIIGSGVYIYNSLSNKSSVDEDKIIADLNNARLFASACLIAGGKVNQPVSGSNICVARGATGNQIWPTLPTGWKYSTSNFLSKDNLSIKVVSGNKEINCDSKGCR